MSKLFRGSLISELLLCVCVCVCGGVGRFAIFLPWEVRDSNFHRAYLQGRMLGVLSLWRVCLVRDRDGSIHRRDSVKARAADSCYLCWCKKNGKGKDKNRLASPSESHFSLKLKGLLWTGVLWFLDISKFEVENMKVACPEEIDLDVRSFLRLKKMKNAQNCPLAQSEQFCSLKCSSTVSSFANTMNHSAW